MEHRTDAELARLAYGRAVTARDQQQATDAGLELERRRLARAQVGGGPAAEGEAERDAEVDPGVDPEADDASAARRRFRRRVETLALVVAVAVSTGLLAQALTPRPSLEIFDQPATEADRAIEQRLDSFDPHVDARIIGDDGESTFFAALTSTTTVSDEPLLCIGIAEFGALTIIECLPRAQFEADGVDTEIPLSPETGGIRIGDGYRYSWGPTGGFSVERLPESG